MINVKEVEQLLGEEKAVNIICRKFDFKPKNIAMFIAAMANTTEKYGYIIIGASKNEKGYSINGISGRLNVAGVIQSAIIQLSNQPIIEYQMCLIEGKNVCIIKVDKNGQDVFIGKNTEEKTNKQDILIRDLYLACIKLQSNSLYKNVTEDQRNDYIRDLLETRRYQVKDQTRRGTSNSGKASGEIDIFIHENGLPITIIEALNLSSLNTTYLDMHIDKIYKYDTLGNNFNVILSYVNVKDFYNFWTKYCDHIKTYHYPYPLIEVDENADSEYQFSDIRFIVTKHNRNGRDTFLYHMCVNLQE